MIYNHLNHGNLQYTIDPNTDWLVACGRNVDLTLSDATIANTVVTSWVQSGIQGDCPLSVNMYAGEASDFQLSNLYIWNSVLPDAEFTAFSDALYD